VQNQEKLDNNLGHAHKKIADENTILRFFTIFYIEARKSVSGQQIPQIFPSSY
jgi:hypothetical protein